MPIPQQRKKWLDQEETGNLSIPDLTLNHVSKLDRNQSWKDPNCDEMLRNRRECIPDLIASQIRYEAEPISSKDVNETEFDEELYKQLFETADNTTLLPGDIFDVILEKKDGSLGLRIYEGTKSNSSEQQHIYIHSINPNSAADIDGRIKPGDRLLEVNEVSLKNLSYQEALAKLRESSQIAHLVLERGNIIDSKQTYRESRKACLEQGSNIDNEDSMSQTMSAAVKRSEFAKVNAKKSTSKLRKDLKLHCSTPNLIEEFEEAKSGNNLLMYPNKSTECLTSPVSSNPHKTLLDIYKKFQNIRGSTHALTSAPSLPVKKKKLRRIEDVYDYSNPDNTFPVSIAKGSRGLGFSIFGGTGVYGRDVFSQLIRIRKFYPLHPALECGKLQLGDVILSVNGTNMVGLTNAEALEVLRTTSSDVVMEVFRPSKSLIPSYTTFEEGLPFCDSSFKSDSSFLSDPENTYNMETKEFEITLIKQSGSLGFTIFKKESSENEEGIYVTALIKEPATSDGRIQPGDKILQVNGVPMSTMSKDEAIEIIRNLPELVTLKLARNGLPPTPNYTEKDNQITKPLRWEAMELLNGRMKNKDSIDDNILAKRKINRKLCGSSDIDSRSTDSLSSTSSSSSGQEDVKENVTCDASGGLGIEGLDLQRKQRPKSLDILNSPHTKQWLTDLDEKNLRQQTSMSCPNVDSKKNSEKSSIDNFLKKACKNLIKWKSKSHTEIPSYYLHTEKNLHSDVIRQAHFPMSSHSNEQSRASQDASLDGEKLFQFPCTTNHANNWVNTFDVNLDRGWHGRLGFTLHDPIYSDVAESARSLLPKAAEVKAVYPGSLADKDGRIKDGDRIVEVNRKCLLNKPATEVINILNKTTGVMRMVFCRLEKRL